MPTMNYWRDSLPRIALWSAGIVGLSIVILKLMIEATGRSPVPGATLFMIGGIVIAMLSRPADHLDDDRRRTLLLSVSVVSLVWLALHVAALVFAPSLGWTVLSFLPIALLAAIGLGGYLFSSKGLELAFYASIVLYICTAVLSLLFYETLFPAPR